MDDNKDGKTSEDSILLTADIFSEDFDEESDDEPEEVQIKKPAPEESPPVQLDPFVISISIEEERPKYETEKKKKEFTSFVGHPQRKNEDSESESFNKKIHKKTRNPKKEERPIIHTDSVKKPRTIGLGDLEIERKKTRSSKIRMVDPFQKKELNRKAEKTHSEKKSNSGLSLIEKNESKKLLERTASKKTNETRRSNRPEQLSESKPFITKTGEKDSVLMEINVSEKKDTEKPDGRKNKIKDSKISRTSVMEMTAQKPISGKKKDSKRESLTNMPTKKEYSGFAPDMMNAEKKKKTDNGMKIEMMEKKHG